MVHLGVVPQPHIMQAVDSFARAHFIAPSPARVTIGLHYRGNDHWEELPGGQLVPISLYVRSARPVAGPALLWYLIGCLCNERLVVRDGQAESVRNVLRRRGVSEANAVVFIASDVAEALTLLKQELGNKISVVSTRGTARSARLAENKPVHRVGREDEVSHRQPHSRPSRQPAKPGTDASSRRESARGVRCWWTRCSWRAARC